MLIVVGREPNDQYLPLAFAIVETETKDSWSWFMKLLLQDIGERSGVLSLINKRVWYKCLKRNFQELNIGSACDISTLISKRNLGEGHF